MVKAESSRPRPQHVAWQSRYLNCSSTLPESSFCGLPAYLNSSNFILPAVSVFPRFAAPAIPSLKTEQANEMRGFLQYPKLEPCVKETHTGGAMQSANLASFQKDLLIFDHSDNKTRLFYSPVFPLDRSPIVTDRKFAQACDVNEEGQESNINQKYRNKYSLPEESHKNHIVHEESEMHEDTEEINALLYSDDDDDDDYEVTSTARSPLANKRTYVMQEQFEDSMEEVGSYDRPNKRQKLIDGGYNRSSLPVVNASLVRRNGTSECVSDAESKYSSGWAYSAGKIKEDNSMMDDVQLKKDRIRESLRILENLIPGAKGKEPLLVIDGTIEYLKSLMSQTGTPGAKCN